MNRKRTWTYKEQAIFFKRLGELLARGYPLAESLETLMYYLPKKHKADIKHCLAALYGGLPFHETLEELHFHPYLIGYIFFAEKHGSLITACRDGSKMMFMREESRQKLKKILLYPLFLILLTLFLLSFVYQILLPRFLDLFQTFDLEASFFMKLILSVGTAAPVFLYIILVSVSLCICYAWFFFRKKTAMEQKALLASLPFIGSFFRIYNTHYFSMQFSYLLAAGFSIFEVLQLFSKSHYPFFQQIGSELQKQLLAGGKLEHFLQQYNFFEKEISQIVKHGQHNGKLDEELLFYGRYCFRKLEEKIEKTVKTTQPCLYFMIGILIVSIYLAILLPMFQMLEGF
ncbi:type II secretion system F family protein [Bacillaceae bacterium Marseille-Q3522]|nr:type II secretion system F family protein [Bacillaceae bacterium Marseille-Q3522]